MNAGNQAESDAHGSTCAGCLHVGLLALVAKYERLDDNPTARFTRALDVAADLRSLLPEPITPPGTTQSGGDPS